MQQGGDLDAMPPDLRVAWNRFVPDTAARLDEIEDLAAHGAAGTVSAELREAALQQAHDLAGICATFGLTRATAHTKALRSLLRSVEEPESHDVHVNIDAEGRRALLAEVAALRGELQLPPSS